MTQKHSGGIATLTRLGSVDAYGNVTQVGTREWSNEENGNPDEMVEFVRNVLGEQSTILFIIERNINRNVCYYQFDPETNKVVPTWLMIPDDLDLKDMSIEDVDTRLTQEDLSMFETRGYGVSVVDDTHFIVRALGDEVLTIHHDEDGNARATIVIDNKHWILRRIMVQTKPIRILGVPTVTELHIEVEDELNRVNQFFYAV
jgi:hypothetical protein